MEQFFEVELNLAGRDCFVAVEMVIPPSVGMAVGLMNGDVEVKIISAIYMSDSHYFKCECVVTNAPGDVLINKAFDHLPSNERIDILDLSVRTAKFLEMKNIHFVGQLCDTTAADLLTIPGFDDECLREVRFKLGEYSRALAT